jgi:cell division protein FtsW (lipid II flippase)
VTPEHAKKRVNAWVKEMQVKFGLGEPLNESLYEIYSGKKYQVV